MAALKKNHFEVAECMAAASLPGASAAEVALLPATALGVLIPNLLLLAVSWASSPHRQAFIIHLVSNTGRKMLLRSVLQCSDHSVLQQRVLSLSV